MRSVTEQGCLFQLKGCSLSGSSAKCEFLITNKEKERDRPFELKRDLTRIIDDGGREYFGSYFALGAHGAPYDVQNILPADVPMGGHVQFEGIKPGTRKLQLIEISCEVFDPGGWHTALIKPRPPSWISSRQKAHGVARWRLAGGRL
jgi:hypothetical protein